MFLIKKQRSNKLKDDIMIYYWRQRTKSDAKMIGNSIMFCQTRNAVWKHYSDLCYYVWSIFLLFPYIDVERYNSKNHIVSGKLAADSLWYLGVDEASKEIIEPLAMNYWLE